MQYCTSLIPLTHKNVVNLDTIIPINPITVPL